MVFIAFVVLVGGARTAVAANSTGKVQAEVSARQRFVLEFVPRLIEQDNQLVALGHDDPVRARRVNRLLGMRDRIFSAGYESTAVAAACLDLLRLDPILLETPIAKDLALASDYALQAVSRHVPQFGTAVGSDWRSYRRRVELDPRAAEQDHPADPAFQGALPPMVSPPFVGDGARRPVLLELPRAPASSILCRGYAWIPGSVLIATWGDSGLVVVDSAKPGARSRISSNADYEQVAVSSSGEYLAALRSDPREGRVLELFRLAADTVATRLDASRRIREMTFSPRGLRLAWLSESGVVCRDFSENDGARLVTRGGTLLERGLAWSPDSRFLVLTLGARDAAGTPSSWKTVVYDATRDSVLTEIETPVAWSAVWAADSRRLVTIDSTEAGRQVVLRQAFGGSEATAPETAYRVPFGLTLSGAAASVNGTSLALRFKGAGDGPAPPHTSSDFTTWRSDIAIARIRPGKGGHLDPPPPSIDDFDWHPGGDWYVARRSSPLFGRSLWLASASTGDGFPVGGPEARQPRFSSDGRQLAFLEGEPARLVIQDVAPVTPSPNAARQESDRARQAAADGKAVAAVHGFRNAIRLSGGADARSWQGLGRAYLTIAAAMADPWLHGAYLEAASRAFLSAYELGGRQPDIRLDFLDAFARRALVTGRRHAAAASQLAEKRLADLPDTESYARADGLDQAARHLVDAVLWDPWNEHDQALLEGVLVRRAAAGPKSSGETSPSRN